MPRGTAEQVKAYRLRCKQENRRRGDRSGQHRRYTVGQYGLTVDEYERRELEQGGVCAICQRKSSDGKHLCVDHDHVTGVVRGLLCGKCNSAIGLLGDDPLVIYRAHVYVNRSKPL